MSKKSKCRAKSKIYSKPIKKKRVQEKIEVRLKQPEGGGPIKPEELDLINQPYFEAPDGKRYIYVDPDEAKPKTWIDVSDYPCDDNGNHLVSEDRLKDLVYKEKEIEATYKPAMREFIFIKHQAETMRETMKASGMGGSDIEMMRTFLSKQTFQLEEQLKSLLNDAQDTEPN